MDWLEWRKSFKKEKGDVSAFRRFNGYEMLEAMEQAEKAGYEKGYRECQEEVAANEVGELKKKSGKRLPRAFLLSARK